MIFGDTKLENFVYDPLDPITATCWIAVIILCILWPIKGV